MHRLLLPALLVIALVASSARAEWPEKPVRILVPYPGSSLPGETAQAFRNTIAGSELLPQPLEIVYSRRHLSLGAREALEAEPDGYTFLVVDPAIMGAEAAGNMQFGYRDFVPVAETGRYCMLVVTGRDSNITGLGQLIARARAEPGSVVWGANPRGYNHLAGLALGEAAGVRFPMLPTGGAREGMEAILSDRVTATAMTPEEYFKTAFLPSGAENPEAPIVPLAYLGPERLLRLPRVPTAGEAGLDLSFCMPVWWLAPKGTPAGTLEAMAGVLDLAAGSDRLVKFWAGRDMDPTFLRGEALEASLERTWSVIETPAREAVEERFGQ